MDNATAVEEPATLQLATSINLAWLFSSTCLVLAMQIGFAMLETGACRTGNVKTILTKKCALAAPRDRATRRVRLERGAATSTDTSSPRSLADLVASYLAWWSVGNAFAYGSDSAGLIGLAGFFGSVTNTVHEPAGTGDAFYLFQVRSAPPEPRRRGFRASFFPLAVLLRRFLRHHRFWRRR